MSVKVHVMRAFTELPPWSSTFKIIQALLAAKLVIPLALPNIRQEPGENSVKKEEECVCDD